MDPSRLLKGDHEACRAACPQLVNEDSLDRLAVIHSVSCSSAGLQALVAFLLWSGADFWLMWAGFCIPAPSSCNAHKDHVGLSIARHHIVSEELGY